MKKICSIFFLTSLLFSSCKMYAPVFKTVDNIKTEGAITNGLNLRADAVFYNPNRMRCRISDMAVDVLVDKKVVGRLGEKGAIVVKGKKDFRVPVAITIAPEGGILGNLQNLLGLLSAKETEISLAGKVQFKTLFYKRVIPINYSQRISLRDFKL